MKSGVVTGTLGFNLGDVYAVVVTVTDDGSPVLESQVGFDWFIGEVNRSPRSRRSPIATPNRAWQ